MRATELLPIFKITFASWNKREAPRWALRQPSINIC
jgi:hypothetical protein